uniref:Uncharacterized protein n=1 Tax=Rhodnius prolixus TaxID=13249 RepID=T1I3A4_RHOPR
MTLISLKVVQYESNTATAVELVGHLSTRGAKRRLCRLKEIFNECTKDNVILSYRLATDSLIARFKKEKTPVVLLQQITSLQQNPSETLEAFADRIKHISTSLLFKAQQNPLQTLQNLVEKLTTDAFIKSLPSSMKAQVQIKLPKNLDEAQTYATALRDIQSAEPQGSIFAIKKADSPIQSSDKPPSPCKHCSGVHWNSECTQKFQVVNNKRRYQQKES